MISITLPYPPTGNHAVKHTRSGKHYTTAETKAYRQHVNLLVASKGAAMRLSGALAVVVEISPPDRRRRDMDNVWKTLADALTLADLWLDDFQIADLRLIRGAPVKGGAINLEVEALGQ